MHGRFISLTARPGADNVAESRMRDAMDTVIDMVLPDKVIEPRIAASTAAASAPTNTCTSGDDTGSCQKPVSESSFTLPIILGVAIPILGAAILLFILHRRVIKKRREEDANDRHASLDFGLGDVPKHGNRTGIPGELQLEKENSRSRRQVSLEMGITCPYLLPPELQSSRESLHSLSRTIHQNEDPYRQIQYYPSDAGSIRSLSKTRDESSIHSVSSRAPSRFQDKLTSELLPNASPMAKSGLQTSETIVPPRKNSLLQNGDSPVDSLADSTLPPYPTEPTPVHFPEPSIQRKPLTSTGGDGVLVSELAVNDSGTRGLSPMPGIQNNTHTPEVHAAPSISSASYNEPANHHAMQLDSSYTVPPVMSDINSDFGDAFKITPPSPSVENHAEMMRGQRYSMDVPPEQFVQAGLGAPGFDACRISLGFRPLPPDATMETEDPETRANRIRSFYKEYFDESKPLPAGQYVEDYDDNYLGDAAYFDPDTNAFVMPYAQPVARRAMTPPPRGPRFQGPPRGMHGSTGGMGMMHPGPRAYSSASARIAPKAAKPRLPPPADLTTLPTPSKLQKGDYALINPLDFAPPRTYRDRQAGRSESPLGERRPYSPSVPAFAPIVGAFDELTPIPSPHFLRKSGTFTSLDFAPPKKFRDADDVGDSGSIRSYQSGISSKQLGAIRGGAYRISRLPKDAVFSKDDMASVLKPQWGLRT